VRERAKHPPNHERGDLRLQQERHFAVRGSQPQRPNDRAVRPSKRIMLLGPKLRIDEPGLAESREKLFTNIKCIPVVDPAPLYLRN
jgi:hypothetical protein